MSKPENKPTEPRANFKFICKKCGAEHLVHLTRSDCKAIIKRMDRESKKQYRAREK